MIQPWQKVHSQAVGDFRIFRVLAERKISPRTGNEHEVFVIQSVNWVNVIATTPRDELILIEQYRHGSNTVELEVPGGMMDSSETSPEITGARELREETGYAGEAPRVIGQVFPNPAIMSNTCFTVWVPNCELKHPTQFDHGEDLLTRLVPIREAPYLVRTGAIRHSLVIVALYHFELLRTL
jgi:ADP-ribose pyrophosphatase